MDKLTKSIVCDFNYWYFEDGSIWGDTHVILEQLEKISTFSVKIGLKLNFEKCELLSVNYQKNKSYSNSTIVLLVWNCWREPNGLYSTSFLQKNLLLNFISSHINSLPSMNCRAIPKLMYMYMQSNLAWMIHQTIHKS